MTIPAKYHIPLILGISLFLFSPHLDVLYENIMEARNFNTAREMLEHNNWVLTTMNGEPRYEKPPLPTWLTAISGAIFGLDQIWALRLPAALMAMLMVIVLYLLSRKLRLSAQQALNSSLILATSFYILFAGRNGTWDIYAHSFMLVGIYFLVRFFSESKNLYKTAALAGLFIGLSFMSKGPVSHFALLLPFLIAYLWVYGINHFKHKRIPFITLILVTVVLSGWWALAIYTLDGNTAQAIADKEATAWADRNVRPFYYYWSFFTQSGIWTIPAFIGLLYPYLKTRVQNLTAYRFSLIWTLAAVVLLSVIPEKKSRYLLPVLIPLALNTGFYVEYLMRIFSSLKDKRELWPVYFNYGLIASIACIVPIAGYFILGEQLPEFWASYTLVSLAAVAIGILLFKNIMQKNFKALFYLTIAFVCCIITFGFPLVRASYTNPDYDKLAPHITAFKTAGMPVYLYNNGSPELIWDMGTRIPLIQSRSGTNLPTANSFIVIMDVDRIEEFRTLFSDYTITKVDEVDGNITSQADRNYKKRRIAHIFKVEN